MKHSSLEETFMEKTNKKPQNLNVPGKLRSNLKRNCQQLNN